MRRIALTLVGVIAPPNTPTISGVGAAEGTTVGAVGEVDGAGGFIGAVVSWTISIPLIFGFSTPLTTSIFNSLLLAKKWVIAKKNKWKVDLHTI